MTMFGSQWLANAGSGYEISQSIRFNDDDSAHLSRTPGSAGNRKTWTFSAWVKRANLTGGREVIFAANNNAYLQLGPDAASREMITLLNEGSGTDLNWYTTQVFRDPGAWFHVVWQFDTTQASADNRTKLYINGSQVTDFTKAATPDQEFEGAVNNNVEHKIGEAAHAATFYLDAYLAEIHFIDGTAKEASDFGEYNDDGVWIPKAYSGSYGTQGFFIDGRDSSDLGDDESGNGNDFASSGLAAADQMSDSPTNNHCTYNPLRTRGTNTLSNGNLQAAAGSAGAYVTSTFGVSSGKWYWEYTFTGTYNFPIVGIMGTALYQDAYPSQLTNAVLYYSSNGNKYIDSTGSSYGASYAVSDKIGVALNLDDNEITFFKNNSTQGAISISNREYTPLVGEEGSSNGGIIANFGQSDFEYTPPTGFKALNTSNLSAPTIKDGSEYFHNQLYTGNGSSGHAITNDANAGDFQPDFLWLAPRSNGDNHVMWDVARGTTSRIYSNKADPADVDGTAQLTFEADGFDLDTTDVNFNGSGRTYVAWQWKTQGAAGSSNTDGSINTTTTSVNQTAGFSINTYTGTGSNATVGHGLGAVPKMILIKDTTNSESWIVYHEGVGNDGNLYLNLTNAKATQAVFQDTTPTSSVFSLGTTDGANKASGVHVAYCFAEVPGYSSFGSYTGNGSTDGPFVYTGFKPAFVMTKRTNAASDWKMWDNERVPYNVNGLTLAANSNGAESSGTAQHSDFLSNGLKIRGSDTETNGSGSTYVYMAFAENPFGGDGVAPATAR